MGYTTTFEGRFTLSRQLTDAQAKQLFVFSASRHDRGEEFMPGAPMPGAWCDWVPVKDARGKWRHLAWNGKEKFYHYTEWLYVLNLLFFSEWGVKVTGSVKFQGERAEDRGVITAKDDEFTVKYSKVGYLPTKR